MLAVLLTSVFQEKRQRSFSINIGHNPLSFYTLIRFNRICTGDVLSGLLPWPPLWYYYMISRTVAVLICCRKITKNQIAFRVDQQVYWTFNGHLRAWNLTAFEEVGCLPTKSDARYNKGLGHKGALLLFVIVVILPLVSVSNKGPCLEEAANYRKIQHKHGLTSPDHTPQSLVCVCRRKKRASWWDFGSIILKTAHGIRGSL